MKGKEIAFARIFKSQNDKIISKALLPNRKGWTVLHNVILQDQDVIYLSGCEYILAHFKFGIVIIDILPTQKTHIESIEKVNNLINQSEFSELFGALPTVRIIAVHHSNINTLQMTLDDIFSADGNALDPHNEMWVDALKKTLKASQLAQQNLDAGPDISCSSTHLPTYHSKHRKKFLAASYVFCGGCALVFTFITQYSIQFPVSLMEDGSSISVVEEKDSADAMFEVGLVPMPAPPAVNQLLVPEVRETAFAVAAPLSIPLVPRPTPILLPMQLIIPPAPNPPQPFIAGKVASSVDAAPGTQVELAFPRIAARTVINSRSMQHSNTAQQLNEEKCLGTVRSIVIRAQVSELDAHDLQILRRGC